MKRRRAISASVVLIGAIASCDGAGGGPSTPSGGAAPGRGRAAPPPRGRVTPSRRGGRHQPSSSRRSAGTSGRSQRPSASREDDDILDLDFDDDGGSGSAGDMFPFDDDITSKLDRDIMAELDRLDGEFDPDDRAGGVGYGGGPADDGYGEYMTTDDDGGEGSDTDEDYAGTSSEKGALYDAYNLLHSLAQVRNS